MERDAEAVEHWTELLRLDRDDHLGVRYRIVPVLLELNRDAETAGILAGFANDPAALLSHAQVLVDFRRGADADARRSLERAMRGNRHVLKYLAGSAELPAGRIDRFVLGSEEEAIAAATSCSMRGRRRQAPRTGCGPSGARRRSGARRGGSAAAEIRSGVAPSSRDFAAGARHAAGHP